MARPGRPAWAAVFAALAVPVVVVPVVVLPVVVLPVVVLPGVGAGDPRVVTDPRVMPWAATARLNIPGIARCSAVVVAPHWAVTAGHCLGRRKLGHVVPARAIHLVLGYVDGAFTRHIVPDGVFPAEGADDAADGDMRHRGQDFALLHLAEAAAEILPPELAELAPGTAVLAGGYGQDRSERLSVDAGCSTLGYVADADRQPLLAHNCNATLGTSGGAVVVRAAGRWRLAGMQEAGNRGVAGGQAIPGFVIGRALAALEAGR